MYSYFNQKRIGQLLNICYKCLFFFDFTGLCNSVAFWINYSMFMKLIEIISGPGYPTGRPSVPFPTPGFPTRPSTGQQYDKNGGYKY